MQTLLLVLLFPLIIHARFLHSIPEDSYAFPKFRVSFLNTLPLLNKTAHQWLTEGLRGGQLEFLDQPWKDVHPHTPSHPKEIESGNALHGPHPSIANYTLELMKIGTKDSYLCLIPKPADHVPPIPEESDFEIVPSRSWSLLQPLSGVCLYHRQGWFTYSYCHNEEIRQFKELSQAPSANPTAGHRPPEEDPEWESYTLGKAPKPGADLTVAEEAARAANLQLARGAGSRYLVQKWGDGTLCDKTGRSREVEVQFHCSMTMTDTILFVKEAKTCSYILVIHTPRLCGEPGFKSRRDTGEENQIRCREIVDTISPATSVDTHSNLPDADHPLKLPHRRPILPAPVKGTKADGTEDKGKVYNDMLRKTIEAIMGNKGGKQGKVHLEEISGDKDNVVFEIVEEADVIEGEGDPVSRFADALREAGYDIKAGKITVGNKKGDKKIEKEQEQVNKKKSKKNLERRDEL